MTRAVPRDVGTERVHPDREPAGYRPDVRRARSHRPEPVDGSEDEATPETIRPFSEMNPFGKYADFPGGTHSIHLEQPVEFIGALREFLE